MKYPQKVIFKISISNKDYSDVTVQQLHSNKHGYFILKETVAEAQFEFCIPVCKTNTSLCVL